VNCCGKRCRFVERQHPAGEILGEGAFERMFELPASANQVDGGTGRGFFLE
jgi:hypothetical protein